MEKLVSLSNSLPSRARRSNGHCGTICFICPRAHIHNKLHMDRSHRFRPHIRFTIILVPTYWSKSRIAKGRICSEDQVLWIIRLPVALLMNQFTFYCHCSVRFPTLTSCFFFFFPSLHKTSVKIVNTGNCYRKIKKKKKRLNTVYCVSNS